ncbi:MAG: hypothetical protein HC828_17655 [Blastochloris sp.]|nr:hypothetical protein [Blastochloris sp.]
MKQQSIAFTIELTPDDLRELAGLLNWAVFQFGYEPHTCSREHMEGLATQVGYQALQLAQHARLDEHEPTLQDQITIFVNANDEQKPYRVFLTRKDTGIEVWRLHSLTSAVEFCQQHGLPIFSSDSQLQAELRTHGIESVSLGLV